VDQIADDLDRVVRSGRTVPLTGQIRIDKEAVYDIVDRLRDVAAAPPQPIEDAPDAVRTSWRSFLDLVDELDDLAFNAKSRRGRLRINTPRADEILRGLLDRLATLETEGATEPDPRSVPPLVEEARRIVRAGEERGVDGESLWSAIDGIRAGLPGIQWVVEGDDTHPR
jgi:hypothetical protein